MFLLDSLLVGGLRFVLDKVATVVDTEMNDETAIREQLLAAQLRLELGEIGQEEFDTFEADILVRLREIRARQQDGESAVPRRRTTRSSASMRRSKGTNISRPRGVPVPETAIYVYCLVECGRLPPLAKAPPGLPGGTALTAIPVSKQVWAVTAEIPLTRYGSEQLEARLRDINWVADIAVRHEAVVEYFAAGRGATVVPMKLFTMFSSGERARADLTSRRAEIAAVLKRIRGCQEWGVRVTHNAPAAVAGGRVIQGAPSGTAFLAAKKRVRDEARERVLATSHAAESAFATLTRLARSAVRREAPPDALSAPLIDAAFLVTSASRARFRAAAKRSATACRRVGAELVLTGPWPPYNFVTLADAGARA